MIVFYPNMYTLCLQAYMPLPPDSDELPEPSLEFSYVECLMYSLHRIARHCPDIITKDPEKLKDFRLRFVTNLYNVAEANLSP